MEMDIAEIKTIIKVSCFDIQHILMQYKDFDYRYEIIWLYLAFIQIKKERNKWNILYIDDDELMKVSWLTLWRFQRARKELQLFSIDTLCAWKPNPWKEVPEFVKYTYNITF